MNRIAIAVVAVLLVALALTPGHATPPAAVIPLPAAAVPSYGSTYPDPGELVHALKDVAASNREVAAELKLLREGLRSGGTTSPAAIAAPKDGLAIAKRECSSCHSAGRKEPPGGGLVLFDSAGGLAPLGDRDRERSASRVLKGSMPEPPARIAEDERKILAAFLRSGKAGVP